MRCADKCVNYPAFAPVSRCVRLQKPKRVTIAAPVIWSAFRRDFKALRRTKEKAGERHWRFSAPMPFTAARSAGCHGGLRDFEIDADLGAPNMLWRYSLEKCPFAPCFQGF